MSTQTARHRILIVEDDPIIAMMLEDAVRGLGLEPIGPIFSVAGALELLNGHDVSAAVLDCNLGDEYVWPVADRLAAIHVPFLFSTGYGRPVLYPRRRPDAAVTAPCDRLNGFTRAVLPAGDKPTGTLRDEAVKILPVHSARGMQFRIVLLLWTSREDGIDRSLLYVAMTRTCW